MKNKIAKITPAIPTKPAAMPPTTIDVLVPPVPVEVALGVAEVVVLLGRGRKLVSVMVGTLLDGRTMGVMGTELEVDVDVVEVVEVVEVVVGEVDVVVVVGVLLVVGVADVVIIEEVASVLEVVGGASGPAIEGAEVDDAGGSANGSVLDDVGPTGGNTAVGLNRGCKPRTRCAWGLGLAILA